MDVLVCFIVFIMVFKVGEKIDDFFSMYFFDLMIILVNLVGLLVMSVFCGFDDNNLFIGL